MDPRTVALLLAAALLLPTAASAASGSVDLALSSGGALAVDATVVDPNGSALRYAMDGNFTPLLDLAVADPAQRATILGEIEIAESTPLLGSYFGNHDGTVEASEAARFAGLLEQQASLLPPTGLTGGSAVALTLDGANATSAKLTAIAFLNATGPDTSAAPVTVTTSLGYQFAYGSGDHVLALTFAAAFPGAPTTGTSVDVALTTPAATAIHGTAGFSAGASVANDPWGLGSGHLAAGFEPGNATRASVDFGPAFPTAYVVLGIAAAAGVAIAVLGLRRRARRRAG